MPLPTDTKIYNTVYMLEIHYNAKPPRQPLKKGLGQGLTSLHTYPTIYF